MDQHRATMTNKPQNDTRRRVSPEVQAHQRDKFVREQIAKDRATSAVKTAKLRALRLAKEAADKEAEQRRTLEDGVSKTDTKPGGRKRARRP
jgi:hypothetical protein